MKHLDRVDAELPQRLLGAKRHVRVRVRAVHDLHERAIGNGGGHVANLHQARQAKLADAIEVGDVEPRANHAIGEERQGLLRKFRKGRHGEHRRVGRDVGFEVGADAREGRVDVDRRQVARALVHHVAGHRGEPFVALEIGGRSDRQHEHERDDRQRPMLGRPQRQPIGQPILVDARKPEWQRRADKRKPRAVRPPHDTTAGVESGSASESLPFGTTLTTTRLSVRRYFRTARCKSCCVMLA